MRAAPPKESKPALGVSARLRELRDLLQVVASGQDLHATLAFIATWVERLTPGTTCSVLLLDESGTRIRHGAAPSLPDAYNRAIDGLPIGPAAGSCGAAMYTGAPVVVADIATHPFWADYRDAALPLGLRACWSHPIFSAAGAVIGSFAVYKTEIATPSDDEWRIVTDASQLASLVIDRAQADARRAAQAREMSAILEHASDLIVRVTPARRLSYVNPAAARLLQRPGASAVGATGAELGVPDAAMVPWREALDAAQETRRTQRLEALTEVQGVGRWHEATITPEFHGDGSLASFIIVSRDVTDRRVAERHLRESENRLHTILDTCERTIALLDTEGRFVDFGVRAEVTAGLPREAMLGARFWEMPPFIDFPESRHILREAIEAAARGEVRRGEVTYRSPSGGTNLASYTAAPIFEGEGRVSQVIIEGDDITDQRELEARVRQLDKMESLGRLAGGIAHDFNNVLAAIQGYGELLVPELPAGSEAADNLQQVLAASRRARDLVRQILAFSRKTAITQSPLDLRTVVADAGRLLRAGLPATIILRDQLPDEPLVVMGEASQLSQVLLNLGANAEHAMRGTGGGVLEIVLGAVTLDAEQAAPLALPAGPYARLEVRDSGHGIPPAIAQKIFEPFFTTKAVGEGTGMGLAVVHGIVVAHRGAVRARPGAAGGSVFEVLLPSVAERLETSDAAPPAATGSGRVLVVDDEEAIVSMLRRFLPRSGYDATCVTSPAVALDLFERDPSAFDLVVTDRTMPGMTGEELIARLHAIRPGLPVVLCTGFGHNEGAEAEPPHVHFLAKPFELTELLRAMTLARA